MNTIARYLLALSLGSLAFGCGTDKDKPTAEESSSPASAETVAPTCAQQVAELTRYLADLKHARVAIASDPLTSRQGALMTGDNVAAIPKAAITPIPEGLTIEVERDDIYIAGKLATALEPGAEPDLESRIMDQLGPAVCPVDAEIKRQDIVLVAHPDAPWSTLRQIIRAADRKGAERILLAFVTASGVTPNVADLEAVVNVDPDAAFAACPTLRSALDSGDEAAIASAVERCACAVQPATVRAFAYVRSGLSQRGGQIPTAVSLPFIDPDAGPDSVRTVLVAEDDKTWAQTHDTTLDAIAHGGALTASEYGAQLDDKLTAVDRQRGVERCKALAAARKLEIARKAGILQTLKQTQGGAFTSLTGTAYFSSGIDDENVLGGLIGTEVGKMRPGFGINGTGGTGAGGGGIGYGDIGTIGSGAQGVRGSGGSGGGAMGLGRLGTGRSPRVSAGTSAVNGALDRNIISRYIRRKLSRIRYCYEKQLLLVPDIKGKVVATFDIKGNGSVANATAKGIDVAVANCVASVISTIKFPAPKDGKPVSVSYPFIFNPS